jgi:hypothetical protein
VQSLQHNTTQHSSEVSTSGKEPIHRQDQVLQLQLRFSAVELGQITSKLSVTVPEIDGHLGDSIY